MRTGLTKKQKVTEVYYNAKDAAQFPELCQQTDDDEQGGLRFEIDKSRISIRLTAPYTPERVLALKNHAHTENLI